MKYPTKECTEPGAHSSYKVSVVFMDAVEMP